MLNPELWTTGGTTMAVGMGIVFAFLAVMVCAMSIMANAVAWLNKVCPLPEVAPKAVKKTVKTDDSAIAVAIATVMSKIKK